MDSDSHDEYAYEKMEIEMYEISSEDEVLEVISNTEEEPTTSRQMPPVIIIDDDSLEIPELNNWNSYDNQIYSHEREVDVLQRNSPDNVPPDNVHENPDIGENLSQSPSSSENNPEIRDQILPTTEQLVSVADQSRKRKCKTKNISVIPGKLVY